MAAVTIHYFASARAAAGTSTEVFECSNIAEALSAASAAHGSELARILDIATVLVDGSHYDGNSTSLQKDVTVEVLPPFAGG